MCNLNSCVLCLNDLSGFLDIADVLNISHVAIDHINANGVVGDDGAIVGVLESAFMTCF